MTGIHYGSNVKEKIDKIVADGADKLHIMADFDRTLTEPSVSGFWKALSDSPKVSEAFKSEHKALFDKYRPLEVSLEIGEQERRVYMLEWWTKVFEILYREKLTRQDLEELITNQKSHDLRVGAYDLLKKLNDLKVPVVILSSGVGDFINIFLDKVKANFENIKVVSNYFAYDNNDVIVGLKYPDSIIHIANKDESDLPENIKELIKDRPNVIILGDMIDDLKMVNLPGESVLSFGFLERNIEESREAFRNVFDVVLEDNQSMGVVSELLRDLK